MTKQPKPKSLSCQGIVEPHPNGRGAKIRCPKDWQGLQVIVTNTKTKAQWNITASKQYYIRCPRSWLGDLAIAQIILDKGKPVQKNP